MRYMKFLVFSLSLLLCSALFSCSESETTVQEEVKGYMPTLTANINPIQHSRTQVNGSTGDLKWTADDALLVFVHETGKTPTSAAEWQTCRYKFVTDAVHCTTNSFWQAKEKEKVLKLDPSKQYDWYVMAPYCETVISPVGDGIFRFDNPVQDFANETRHLGTKTIMTCVDLDVPANEKVAINLQHQATLMTFKVYNKLGVDMTPKQISFETKTHTPTYIGGTFAIDFQQGIQPIEAKPSVHIDFANAPVVKPESFFEAYAIMPPFSLNTGEQFRIQVITDKSNSLQTSTMRKPIAFKAGTINRASVKVTHLSVSNNINPWESQGEIEGEIEL